MTHYRVAPVRAGRTGARAGRAGPLPAPVPADEPERLQDLQALDVLDTPRERGFDRLVFIAAQVFRVPVAAVSFVDRGRQWFKAKVGPLPAETRREVSFCAHALHAPDPFVVRDTLRDPRFQRNPLVTGGPRFRFYAGVPLTGPGGKRVGTLCILDTRPRTLTAAQASVLASLAREVTTLLAARRPPRDTLTPADSPFLDA